MRASWLILLGECSGVRESVGGGRYLQLSAEPAVNFGQSECQASLTAITPRFSYGLCSVRSASLAAFLVGGARTARLASLVLLNKEASSLLSSDFSPSPFRGCWMRRLMSGGVWWRFCTPGLAALLSG